MAHRNLSRSQFKALHTQVVDPEVGGFTIHAVTGEQPKTGWMVADEAHEEKIPNEELHPSRLPRYVRRNREELARPGSYFGGWNAGEATYLDVSRRWHDRRMAETSMTLANQQSMYNQGTGVTVENPSYDRTARQAWRTALESGGSPERGPDFLRRMNRR